MYSVIKHPGHVTCLNTAGCNMHDFREFLDWGNWSVKYEMTDTRTEREKIESVWTFSDGDRPILTQKSTTFIIYSTKKEEAA